jgi:hypothetical protein
MMTHGSHIRQSLLWIAQTAAILSLIGIALALATSVVLATVGFWPWLEVVAEWRGEAIAHAGIIFQVGMTLLALGLLAFVPSSWRVMQLENSHRQFTVRMEDVARAYHAAHAADRAGLFTLRSEFDAVRERMLWLRDHPDLSALEPELLEMAAQMSRTSHELAQTYSDANVRRAHHFLDARREEVDRLETLLADARVNLSTLQSRLARVKLYEEIAETQADNLRAELRDLLAKLDAGTTPGTPAQTATGDAAVLRLPSVAAE